MATFGRINESHIKHMIVQSMRQAGGYARRIEDQFLVGTPDMILIPRGYPVFFAEVKIVKAQQLAPTPRQYIELTRIKDTWVPMRPKHVFPILIGWKDGVYYFHESVESAKLVDCFSVTRREMNFYDQLIQFCNGRLMK